MAKNRIQFQKGLSFQDFHEACREIYEEIPEIVVYLRDGFTATPQEMLNFTSGPGDRAVLAAVLAVEGPEENESEELPEL